MRDSGDFIAAKKELDVYVRVRLGFEVETLWFSSRVCLPAEALRMEGILGKTSLIENC
jgi:hypothetical protein